MAVNLRYRVEMRLPYCMSSKTFKKRSWISWEKSRASRPLESSWRHQCHESRLVLLGGRKLGRLGREFSYAIRRPSFLMSSHTSRPVWGSRVVLVDGPYRPRGLPSSALLTRTSLSESLASESRSRSVRAIRL